MQENHFCHLCVKAAVILVSKITRWSCTCNSLVHTCVNAHRASWALGRAVKTRVLILLLELLCLWRSFLGIFCTENVQNNNRTLQWPVTTAWSACMPSHRPAQSAALEKTQFFNDLSRNLKPVSSRTWTTIHPTGWNTRISWGTFTSAVVTEKWKHVLPILGRSFWGKCSVTSLCEVCLGTGFHGWLTRQSVWRNFGLRPRNQVWFGLSGKVLAFHNVLSC